MYAWQKHTCCKSHQYDILFLLISDCRRSVICLNKYFNTTGLCSPELHYMVNIDEKLNEIQRLVDQGNYFVINRARQYGKTTTLNLLTDKLAESYTVFFISFEGFGDSVFENTYSFCRSICGLLYDTISYGEVSGISEIQKQEFADRSSFNGKATDFRALSNLFSELCRNSQKPVVLLIDEIDQASNQAPFLAFLGMLRDKYLKRTKRPTFHSVILAGVYDIKNLKLKIRGEEEHRYNSPWNIAADFRVNMNFSSEDIAGMLSEYKNDHCAEMDLLTISKMIYDYTSGYPFLVSRICKIIDEQILNKNEPIVWSKEIVLEAVRILLNEKNTLFESMTNKLHDYPELHEMIYSLLFTGRAIVYNPDNPAIDIAIMFGFVKVENNLVQIANRIFETRLYNMFLSAADLQNNSIYKASLQDKNQFIVNGMLDMDRVIMKFVQHFSELYGDCEDTFVEEVGRRYFLLYLKPIINGTGNYYIESRTRDMRRTDVIVDYHGQQFVIEMKIWHGEEYNRKGEEQLLGYLNDYHLQKGYLLSFSFNKNKKIGVIEHHFGDISILEAIV